MAEPKALLTQLNIYHRMEISVALLHKFPFTWIEDCTPSSERRICRSGLGRGTCPARQRKLRLWVGRVSNSWPSPPSQRWQRPGLSGRQWPQPLRTSQTWRWCRQTGKIEINWRNELFGTFCACIQENFCAVFEFLSFFSLRFFNFGSKHFHFHICLLFWKKLNQNKFTRGFLKMVDRYISMLVLPLLLPLCSRWNIPHLYTPLRKTGWGSGPRNQGPEWS